MNKIFAVLILLLGISGAGALRNVSGDNSWAGAIVLGSDVRINSDAGSLTLTGGVTGEHNLTVGGASNTIFDTGSISTLSGTLTKDGNGTLTLNSAGGVIFSSRWASR